MNKNSKLEQYSDIHVAMKSFSSIQISIIMLVISIFAEDEFRRFHFRRKWIVPIPLSTKWIFHRKSFKVENNRFCLNDLPLINYIIAKWNGNQLT
jgi:hypothetical protein